MPNGKKISMGGNTGIFYGKKEIDYPNDGNPIDPVVEFTLDEIVENSEIEGSRLPLIDDLILNIDGCFYRVMDIISPTTVTTNRITLQGSGIGPGGGEGSGSASLRIIVSSSSGGYYSSDASSMPIIVTAYSSDTENYISNVECSFNSNFTDPFLNKPIHAPLEKPYEIDLIS